LNAALCLSRHGGVRVDLRLVAEPGAGSANRQASPSLKWTRLAHDRLIQAFDFMRYATIVVMPAVRSSSQQRNTGLSASHEVVLAEAKLGPPRMRSQTIERLRVTRALDAGAPALTLVAAPAGYGKTTAVRAWCAHREVPVAWVTLDASDRARDLPARPLRRSDRGHRRRHRGRRPTPEQHQP